MKPLTLANVLWLVMSTSVAVRHAPKRMIELCAEDGYKIDVFDLRVREKSSIPAGRVGELDLSLSSKSKDSTDTVLSFVRNGKIVHETTLDAFEGPYGWLTISDDNTHFAFSWKSNGYISDTKLFTIGADGGVSEDGALADTVRHRFLSDARRACHDPAVNLQAIKWIDRDHLLLAANSWSSLTCQANFDEGFILEPQRHAITRRLTQQQLINLPTVCTSK